MHQPASRQRFGALGYGGLCLIGSVGTVLAAIWGLTHGAAPLTLTEVFGVFTGVDDPAATAIVWQLRLPRIAGAAMVGGALAVVGAVLQAVLRNPLADPYILGISSGASVGAALAALISGAAAGWFVRTGLAFVAALLSVFIVYSVARVGTRLPPARLILAGVALSSFSAALTGFLLYMVPDATAMRGVVFWLMGGLSATRWTGVIWTAGWVLPLVGLLLASARWQTTLLLGEEAALALGLDVTRVRRGLIVVCALTAGALVAFAGAIGFVGLIVPHALRPFTGPDHRRLLPAAFLFGAVLLVTMDTVSRTLLAPEELPVGILTGLLGAPFFLMLLRQRGGTL